MANALLSPSAHLHSRFVIITSRFAQKKDTKPVGGRGISAFWNDFFLLSVFSLTKGAAGLIAVSGTL